jgi:hypothetical protein
MSVSGFVMSAKTHYLRWRYHNYRGRANHTRAIAAQAHKVAQWVYGCWKHMEPFDEYRAFRYQEWRANPHRWVEEDAIHDQLAAD